MDRAALERLNSEQLGWRYKGFPAAYDGMSIAKLIATKPALTAFGTPLLTLSADALAHNLATMADYCAQHGVDLAPHGKTTMAPQLFARQLDAGAWGLTAATIAHVRAYRAFGVECIVLANQVVDPDALGWIAAEMRDHPDFRLLCFADSVAGVELMQSGLAAGDAPRPAARPVEIVLDLGLPGGRTGSRDTASATAVARAVHAADRLRLVGVGGFEGALAVDRSAGGIARVREYLRFVRDTAIRLDGMSLFDEVDEIILTAGGSAYFDHVVEILTEPWPSSRPIRTVLRSGAYITHDDGHYRVLTPLTGADVGPGPFRPALSLLGRVLSLPEPGLALLDFGKRDAPYDLGLPEPHDVRRADGSHAALDGCAITALADQHAFLSFGPDVQLSIGDVVTCGISHPCTAFDKWQMIPVVEDGHVVDIIRTFF